jgi:hypothetical protein
VCYLRQRLAGVFEFLFVQHFCNIGVLQARYTGVYKVNEKKRRIA